MTLKCIGRTDSLGTPDQWGSNIGFIYEVAGGKDMIVIDEPEAVALFNEMRWALWMESE